MTTYLSLLSATGLISDRHCRLRADGLDPARGLIDR